MSYKNIEAHAVGELLARDDVVVIDTRDGFAQSQGRLPKAQPANDDVIGSLMMKRRSNPPVLVYCYEGHSSRDMCTFLHQMGLSEVYNLVGGWAAWAALSEPAA